MTTPPPTKRPRVENEPEEELTEQLFLQNDEEGRRQRERQRRERWRSKMMQQEPLSEPPQEIATIVTTPIKTIATKEKEEELSQESNDRQDNDEDDFDMFSSSVSPVITTTKPSLNNTKTDDFQDAEGYYKATIGERLQITDDAAFTVLGVVGKGVFSTVLKCSFDEKSSATNNSTNLPETVALKCIRNNETMSRAAKQEVTLLQKLSQHPHIIPLLLPQSGQHLVDFRGHVVMIFPYQPYNLREVLQKFGKGVGLSLAAVKSYFLQLLSALLHLQKHDVIHADIKPDNMLVTQDFGTLQLCDFGSAMEVGSADALPTPYLVSRYYRAPETILGAVPTPALDLWAVGVTVVELFIGTVAFAGRSNNGMLRVFMEVLGPFSAKTLRQHLVQVGKLGIPAHFAQRQQQFVYLQQTEQIVNGKHVVKEVVLQGNFPTRPLQQVLLKAKSAKDSRLQVQQLANLLQRVLSLELTKRISVREAMKHPFFTAGTSTDANQG
jgi:serine/threonine-protein kinase PRP4